MWKKIEKIEEKIWSKKKKCPKKNLKKKNLGKKKIGVFCFAGGDILKSCAQSKFETQWLKIALFRTAHTFWGPKMPQNRPIYGKKLEICKLYTWQIANVMYMRF